MTKLLEDAFALAKQLPDAQQNELASRIIAELTEDDDFDRKIVATAHKLDWLIEEARAGFRAGLTEPMDPDRL